MPILFDESLLRFGMADYKPNVIIKTSAGNPALKWVVADDGKKGKIYCFAPRQPEDFDANSLKGISQF